MIFFLEQISETNQAEFFRKIRENLERYAGIFFFFKYLEQILETNPAVFLNNIGSNFVQLSGKFEKNLGDMVEKI